jgi:flagellar basal-body rod modification protein FlgD
MSTVDTITSNSTTQVTGSIAKTSMGKEDFLTLLVTQLQNQDPLNPSDPTEFTAQLSQFSSLEQLTTVNDNLEGLMTYNSRQQQLASLSLLGQDVVARADQFELSGDAITLGYQLPATVDQIQMVIQDDQGNVVATLETDDTEAGEHFFTWDGTTDSGSQAPSGSYALLISATVGDETKIDSVPLIKGTVTGVDLSDPQGEVLTAGGSFSLDDIIRIKSNS